MDDVLLVIQGEKKQEITPDVARDKVVGPDVLLSVDAQSPGKAGLLKQLLDPEGRPVDGPGQDPRVLVGDLQGDAADGGGDDGVLLPQGLGHGQAEPLLA